MTWVWLAAAWLACGLVYPAWTCSPVTSMWAFERNRQKRRRWYAVFACLTAAAAFALLGLGVIG